MLVIILLTILQLGLALNPATFRKLVKDCDAKVEDIPWQITNFITFEKKLISNHTSYMCFHFADINNRLELNTTCIRTIPLNSTASLGGTGKTFCNNDDVAFEWDGVTLELSRYYTDKCLGVYPYNSAIAYGRASINRTRVAAVDGVYGTTTEVHMPISSLS